MGTFCRAIFPNFDEYATGNVTFYLKMYVFRPSSAIFQYLAADLGLLRVRKRFRRGHSEGGVIWAHAKFATT